MNETLTKQIADFVQSVVSAMGVVLTVTIEESPEGDAHQSRRRRWRRPDPPRR